MVDTLRAGRFVIVGLLGEGSQGRTLDGVDKQAGKAVAIKRFDVRGARGWKDVELAERETRVLQTLAHPNLPRYVDHFEEQGALYLVTEKMEGASLADLRRQGAPFGEADAMRLLGDASSVLAYLHGRSPPVVHRDIKPANVIRRPDGSYAFVDFGAVKDNLRPEGGSTVVGTFGFMAPEQFQGRALPGSDVYGVGATVLSLLTGEEPEALPHRGLAIDVRAALRGRASERMTRILERMLEPDPDRRAADIASLLEGAAGTRRDRPRGAREAWHLPNDPWDETWRRDVRHQARWARRAAREEAKAWRRAHRQAQGVPWPLEVLFTLVFSVGLVAVSVVTQVTLPLLLRVLSIFVARRQLTAAADAVQEAGGAAVRAISQSRRWMRADVPDETTRARVATESGASRPAGPGIHVAPMGPDEGTEDEEQQPAARRKM